MNTEIMAFQAEVRGRRGARKKGAAPYEGEMVARGRALAMRLLDGGEPAVLVARQLGIARKTLMKWLGEPAGPPPRSRATAGGGFVRVGLKTAHQDRAIGATNAVRLVSPRGYMIEGIDAATAVAILREVG